MRLQNLNPNRNAIISHINHNAHAFPYPIFLPYAKFPIFVAIS